MYWPPNTSEYFIAPFNPIFWMMNGIGNKEESTTRTKTSLASLGEVQSMIDHSPLQLTHDTHLHTYLFENNYIFMIKVILPSEKKNVFPWTCQPLQPMLFVCCVVSLCNINLLFSLSENLYPSNLYSRNNI